ncbi:ABC transporter permease [Intrasporangium calvum]|uniref:ABC transporter permease n=1 Tax=Intrasporangium calvum TaxID=53358 RepID=A0ABT5GF02_9MICO|nr:ABC transporter permease [Intrasporangium calvum]MDC5696784.1 ABC transporter permease [Intrasporangium calvum]
MSKAIKAEFRKFFTTRLWWGMLIAIVVAGAALAALFALLFTSDTVMRGDGMGVPTSDADLARTAFTSGIGVGYLLTLAIGVMTVGAEYRHKTITATFLAEPKRSVVMGAKTILLLVVGAMYGAASLLASVATGAAILSSRGHEPFADPEIWRTLALSLLVLGLWALIGLGVGILIPNQVAALLIAVGVAWIVEPIVGAVLPLSEIGGSIARYLPSQATNATLDIQTVGFGGPVTDQLPWWGGALVLTGYAVVMALIGTLRTVRSDIS